MAYLGDGISSDYDDYSTEEGKTPEEEEIEETTPPLPREDLEEDVPEEIEGK